VIRCLAWTCWLGLLSLLGCARNESGSAERILGNLKASLAAQDVGATMALVDLLGYHDDVGGPGRLEDDLRRFYLVYGSLRLHTSDEIAGAAQIRCNAVLEGKALRYEGPLVLGLKDQGGQTLIQSGLLSELRGIIYTLRERRLALEKGSVERMEELVSAEYTGGKNMGKSQLLQQLRQDLASVQRTAIMVKDLTIESGLDQARAVQSCWIVTHVGEKVLEDRIHEELGLHKEGSRWRFIRGLN
jgi:hypothetical protein